MVGRNDILWADLGPPAGRRPVCVLTRTAAVSVLNTITCVEITRTIRGIASEVEVGPRHGLPEPSVINCDSILAVPIDRLDPEPVGRLDRATRALLDKALRYSLDIVF